MSASTTQSVGELVREMETNFISGGGTLTSKYVTSDLYEDISKIYAYLESTHITTSKDSKGRDKPFFNIVVAARNIYYRATDIDRKNIQIAASKVKQTVPAFMATVLLQNWMRKENYGAFLNQWGMVLAAFNSAIVKHIESEGELHPMVVPWSRIICDQIDFASNPKIEILELTEAQLYQRIKTHNYNAEMVDKLCDALQSRENTDHSRKDQKANYIKLYEVHMDNKKSYLTDNEEDEDTFVQQMHVISFIESKEKGEYDDFTLVSGEEAEDPYMLTELLPSTDGSISLSGAVKNLFEEQWMMNHSVKAIKDRLDLSSKLVFQTADSNFVGRNMLTSIENGDIMVHAVNMPMTKVDNDANDITILESFSNMWKGNAAEKNGISESMLGAQSPSGTAWRQVQAELAEAHSLFELMTENKALHLEEMLRRFVIKYLKKQMDTSEEISAVLEAHNITKIDAIYVPNEAAKRHNDAFKAAVLAGKVPDTMQQGITTDQSLGQHQMDIKQELGAQGNQRFFVPDDVTNATWKKVLKDLEWELEIDITGEAKDQKMVLDTISTALVTIMNPGYAGNPAAQMLVGKALSLTGVVSPIEFSALATPQPVPQPQSPVGGGTGGGLATQTQ